MNLTVMNEQVINVEGIENKYGICYDICDVNWGGVVQTIVKRNGAEWDFVLNDKNNVIYYPDIIDIHGIAPNVEGFVQFDGFVCGERIFKGGKPEYQIKNPDFYIIVNNNLIKLESEIKGFDYVSFPFDVQPKNYTKDKRIRIEFGFYKEDNTLIAYNQIINGTEFLYPYGYEKAKNANQYGKLGYFLINPDTYTERLEKCVILLYGVHDVNNNFDHYDIINPNSYKSIFEKNNTVKIIDVQLIIMSNYDNILCLKNDKGKYNAISCDYIHKDKKEYFYFKEWCDKLSIVKTKISPKFRLYGEVDEFLRAEYKDGKCTIVYKNCVFDASLIYNNNGDLLILDNDNKYHIYNDVMHYDMRHWYRIKEKMYKYIGGEAKPLSFDAIYYIENSYHDVIKIKSEDGKENDKYAAIDFNKNAKFVPVITPIETSNSPECPIKGIDLYQTVWYDDISYVPSGNKLKQNMIFRIGKIGIVTNIKGEIIDYITYDK